MTPQGAHRLEQNRFTSRLWGNFLQYLYRICCFLPVMLLTHQIASAHGGVEFTDDVCTINIGYYQAHFKIYLPRTHPHQEYCEDLPQAAESVFVIEYLDRQLAQVAYDFRIIRNVTKQGRFAKERHVAQIGNLDSVTEYYRAAKLEPDVFSVVHRFKDPGAYIGIVSTLPVGSNQGKTTVFPFQVGSSGFGYWPLAIVAIVIFQFYVAYSAGWLSLPHALRRVRNA